jgi:hypothetical protein
MTRCPEPTHHLVGNRPVRRGITNKDASHDHSLYREQDDGNMILEFCASRRLFVNLVWVIDPSLPAVTHLTTAFQLAGYPHVVGTLWAL